MTRRFETIGKHCRGAISVEYMMILALVVIPIALLVPLVMRMIVVYSGRVVWVVRTPFG